MTVLEAEALAQQTTQELSDAVTVAKRLLSEGVVDRSRYPDWRVLRSTEDFINIEGNRLEELLDDIQIVQDLGEGKIDFDAYVESGGDRGTIYYTWYEVRELSETFVKEVLRQARRDALKPAHVKHSQHIDCKMWDLFMSAHIDWDTLQKITYEGCTT